MRSFTVLPYPLVPFNIVSTVSLSPTSMQAFHLAHPVASSSSPVETIRPCKAVWRRFRECQTLARKHPPYYLGSVSRVYYDHHHEACMMPGQHDMRLARVSLKRLYLSSIWTLRSTTCRLSLNGHSHLLDAPPSSHFASF
jgi:hypothetical protein